MHQLLNGNRPEDPNRTAISSQHMNENQNTDFKGDKVEAAFLKMHY